MSEIKVIDEFGEIFPLDNFSPEYLKNVDNEQLEDVAYISRIVKKALANPEKELKARLGDGTKFNRVEMGHSTKRMLPQDDDKIKKAFVKKYGWDAVQVKTPAQLEKVFGDGIKEDLGKVTVLDKTERIKWK